MDSVETNFCHSELEESSKDLRQQIHLQSSLNAPAEPYGLMASEEGVVPEVRAMAVRRVRGFLAGTWKQIDERKIIVKKITGGLSNYLYMCQLPSEVNVKPGEPKHAMLRIYGEILQENIDSLVIDTVIFALLAEKGFGPRLYGVFHGGRLEQYINNSRCLRCRELRIPSISVKIAQKVALFHSLEMPLNKEPRYMLDMTKRLLDASDAILWPAGRDHPPTPSLAIVAEKYDLHREWKRLLEIMQKTPSEVVFCHNDVQEGNLLLMENLSGTPRSIRRWNKVSSTSPFDPEEDLKMQDSPNGVSVDLPIIQPIDFEYCAYNYRGFDFGNHFNEWCYDYHVYEYPWYRESLDDYPTKDQQMIFIKAYLETRHKNLLKIRLLKRDAEGEMDFEHGLGTPNLRLDEAAEALYREANVYALLSHFMWAVWSFRQATLSSITFAYNEYGILRLVHYYKHLHRIHAQGLLPSDLSDPIESPYHS